MPNLFHLFILSLFTTISFSGTPKQIISREAIDLPVLPAGVNDEKSENPEYIPWLGDRLLIWEDFQSTPKRNTDAVASTSTSLGLAYQLNNGDLTYQVTCNFSKTKSWGLVKTAYILAHEQGHFDITEIYARRLHQALLEYKFDRKNYQKDINRIYQKIVREKEALQNLYDKQSDHSRNKHTQAAWLEIIDALLTETDPYANYP